MTNRASLQVLGNITYYELNSKPLLHKIDQFFQVDKTPEPIFWQHEKWLHYNAYLHRAFSLVFSIYLLVYTK